jgi:hypothetical protein
MVVLDQISKNLQGNEVNTINLPGTGANTKNFQGSEVNTKNVLDPRVYIY